MNKTDSKASNAVSSASARNFNRRPFWKRALVTLAIYGPLTAFALITVIPFAYLIASSIKTQEVYFNSTFLPMMEVPNEGGAADSESVTEYYAGWKIWRVNWDGLTSHNYTKLFEVSGIGRSLLNSFFYASMLAVLATLGSAMGGYGLAKFEFRGRKLITNIVLISLIVPGALLLAPGYKVLHVLGLLNSYSGLILPGVAPAFGVFLFRQSFISSLPNEMIEAARIDGCSEIRLFAQIGLPMVKPMIGAFMLITYLGAWNNFIMPQIVLQSPEKYPLAVAVAQLRGPYGNEEGLIMAATVVSVLPVLALFLLLQKEFIQGLTSGAVKG